jgi:hypothetical protein
MPGQFFIVQQERALFSREIFTGRIFLAQQNFRVAFCALPPLLGEDGSGAVVKFAALAYSKRRGRLVMVFDKLNR